MTRSISKLFKRVADGITSVRKSITAQPLYKVGAAIALTVIVASTTATKGHCTEITIGGGKLFGNEFNTVREEKRDGTWSQKYVARGPDGQFHSYEKGVYVEYVRPRVYSGSQYHRGMGDCQQDGYRLVCCPDDSRRVKMSDGSLGCADYRYYDTNPYPVETYRDTQTHRDGTRGYRQSDRQERGQYFGTRPAPRNYQGPSNYQAPRQ